MPLGGENIPITKILKIYRKKMPGLASFYKNLCFFKGQQIQDKLDQHSVTGRNGSVWVSRGICKIGLDVFCAEKK